MPELVSHICSVYAFAPSAPKFHERARNWDELDSMMPEYRQSELERKFKRKVRTQPDISSQFLDSSLIRSKKVRFFVLTFMLTLSDSVRTLRNF